MTPQDHPQDEARRTPTARFRWRRRSLADESNPIEFYGPPGHRRRRDFWEVMERRAECLNLYAIHALRARKAFKEKRRG
jgi:hypothetical protein